MKRSSCCAAERQRSAGDLECGPDAAEPTALPFESGLHEYFGRCAQTTDRHVTWTT